MSSKKIDVREAFDATDLRRFMHLVFPDEWAPIAARIAESGAVYGETEKFAPRWSPVPFTVRRGRTDDETCFKSMIFRVHDCLHQLWGLPVPASFDSQDERRRFKRMWMCAEMAVLTLTEFFYCQWLYDTQPHLRAFLEHRNTLAFKRTTPLRTKTMAQTAARLDELLHKRTLPDWVRDNEHGRVFVADYGPMLEQDRVNIDHNWSLLERQADTSYLLDVPNQRYSRHLDGLELTLWMIADFEHLLDTDDAVDEALAAFNARRRERVALPDTWNTPPTTK